MDIQDIIEMATLKQQETENHIYWCINQIVSKLTLEQLGEIAESTGNRRYIRSYQRLVDPTARRSPWTEKDVRKAETRLRQTIADVAHAEIR